MLVTCSVLCSNGGNGVLEIISLLLLLGCLRFFDGSCHFLAFPFDSVWFALETVKILNATQTGMHSRMYSLTHVVWAHIHMHTYSYLSSHANAHTLSLPTHSYVLIMHAPSHIQRYALMCHLTLCFAHTFICTPPCMHIHTDSDMLYCTHQSCATEQL